MIVTLCQEENKKCKPDPSTLKFGTSFTDHMLRIDWNKKNGWSVPHIQPLVNFSLHPAAKVLHYAQEVINLFN